MALPVLEPKSVTTMCDGHQHRMLTNAMNWTGEYDLVKDDGHKQIASGCKCQPVHVRGMKHSPTMFDPLEMTIDQATSVYIFSPE